MVIITMQYISASNQHVLHKLTQSYISIIAQGVCVWAGSFRSFSKSWMLYGPSVWSELVNLASSRQQPKGSSGEKRTFKNLVLAFIVFSVPEQSLPPLTAGNHQIAMCIEIMNKSCARVNTKPATWGHPIVYCFFQNFYIINYKLEWWHPFG